MLILGISNNDVSGACLIDSGVVLSAVHEERFSRIKGDNQWPSKSIDFVLKSNNKTLSEIDFVAYGWHAGFNEDYCLDLYVNRIIHECQFNYDNIGILKKRILDERLNDKFKRNEFDKFIKYNKMINKVCYLDHHDAHAWGAYLCSSYTSALVVTCDGRGDYQSLTVRFIDQGREKVLQRETSIDSLGYFYGRITKLLGFTPNRHEGKITGLASHGNPMTALPLMKKMIDVKDGRLISHCGDYYQPSYYGYSERLLSEIELYSKEDVAAAAQYHLEFILSSIVKQYIDEFSVKNICLSGGVFGNVKLNQKINELPGIESVFVFPSMGDCGLPLAAAVTACYQLTGSYPTYEGFDLGPDYSDEYICNVLAQRKDLNFVIAEDPLSVMISLLSKGKIIGLLRGRAEFGPRALCQRSIIYPAKNKDINDWLNKKLNRTEFMPFAPVTNSALAELCFDDWSENCISSQYMTMTYQCTSLMKQACPAVVHVDGTARPQVIFREKDTFIFDLINKWYQLTGEPALVNTSFNRHEEPIVNTPEEAISVLSEGIIDAILLNDKYVITGS